MQQRMAREKRPKLETKTFFEIDPETGTEIRRTRHRRGVLVEEEIEYADPFVALERLSQLKHPLESLRDTLRDKLEARGIPSDRTQWWVGLAENQWRAASPDDKLEDGLHWRRWCKRVDDLTGRLSEERSDGNALLWLGLVLDDGHSPDELFRIAMFAKYFAQSQRVGYLNDLATMGAKSSRGLATGRVVTKSRASRRRAVICEIAKAWWESHPRFHGDVSNTAFSIAQIVNERLGRERLLPKSGKALSAKTIGTHIKTGLLS